MEGNKSANNHKKFKKKKQRKCHEKKMDVKLWPGWPNIYTSLQRIY